MLILPSLSTNHQNQKTSIKIYFLFSISISISKFINLPQLCTLGNTLSTLSHTQTLYTAYSPKHIAPVGDRMSGLAGPESSEGLKIGTSKPKVASVAYNMSYAEQ